MAGNKRSRVGAAAVLLVAFISVVLVQIWPSASTASTIEEDLLQPGDIIFVDLYNGWCHVGRWDHMALYVGEQPYPGVVEATFNGGVCYTPLPSFLERDYPAHLAVKRLGDVPGREERLQMAISYALEEVGNTFDFSATATIPLKVNRQNQHCVEVIWRAYQAAGIDLDSNNGPLLYPDDLYYSPKLRSA